MFDALSQKFSTFFSRFTAPGAVKEADVSTLLANVRDALVESDVPYDVTEKFIEEIKQEVVGKKLLQGLKPAEQVMKVVHDRVAHFLGGAAAGDMAFTFQLPSVCMVMGLQGAGKTTTIGKLAHYLIKDAGKRGKTRTIMVASVDFYRPAAIDQLELLAKRAGCLFYRASSSSPVEAAREIYKYSQQQGVEILLLDTAGRLHVDEQLLAELAAIDVLVKPKYKLLVVDSMMGQESLQVAKVFDEKVGFTGGIVTKMDSNTKAGVVFAFRYAVKKPLLFMGSGEGLDDFEPFYPDRIAKRMLDLGDINTLLEQAQEKIKQSEQDRLQKSMSSGRMTLQDFSDQMAMIGKMGSLRSVMSYLPGMSQLKVTPDALAQGEKDMKRMQAIISSMTLKERYYPKVLDGSRKRRIAEGAGVKVSDVNVLLERFEQNQQFVTLFKKMKNR